MRWSVALPLSAAILFAACSSQLSGASANQTNRTAPLDQPFTLKPGETVAISTARVQVGFDRVIADSRCPRDVQCIQAGEAAVRALVTLPGKAVQPVEVKTTPDGATATIEGYTLTLTGLEPLPLSARPTRAADYRATFVLSNVR